MHIRYEAVDLIPPLPSFSVSDSGNGLGDERKRVERKRNGEGREFPPL